MITDYFTYKKVESPLIQSEYYELHRSFIHRNNFKKLYNEIKPHLVLNATRESCVCVSDVHVLKFKLYNLPIIDWTETISDIRNEIMQKYEDTIIDYGLVHLYRDDTSNINWHYDKEAMRSNIYSISIGGTRRFCLRDKITHQVITFQLYDGDLFIMKVGCQEKYDHCIKSIKMFNEPRISITFRQIEESIYYFTLDMNNIGIYLTHENPSEKNENYIELAQTRHGITIGYIKDPNDTLFTHYDENMITNNVSLLKSNIQKAVRRQMSQVASSSTMKMIIERHVLDLLRRLTIISLEDVQITKYYPIILWYYIATNYKYELLDKDVNFIYSYVKHICSVTHNSQHFDKNVIQTNIDINNCVNNIMCLSLFLRKEYGGFNGEMHLLNNYIISINNETCYINEDEIIIERYKINDTIEILDCSIDYHCFPKMPQKVLQMLDQNNFTEDDIRNLIWTFDSSINVRETNKINTDCDSNYNTWIQVIKPKCDIYRRYIRNIIT
jgi:2OG-Fe(II) oxygenase superfamily